MIVYLSQGKNSEYWSQRFKCYCDKTCAWTSWTLCHLVRRRSS